MSAAPGARPGKPWSAARYALFLSAAAAAGIAVLRLAAPQRTDWLSAAAAGAAFGAGIGIAGYTAVARVARKSAQKAIQVFLAVAAVKVIAFTAFLLTIALVTTLNPAALAAGLVGATLTGEALLIGSLHGLEGFTEQDRRRQ